jgi:small subunit ribosomal protein S9
VATVTYTGTGRRKTSVARVILTPGVGRVVVNGKDLDDYFGRRVLQTIAVMPFEATHTQAKFDVRVNVNGGGMAGQAGAIRHGIARALVVADENLRTPLKRAGFLTRDARAVERKKAGLKKARKRPQFSKR